MFLLMSRDLGCSCSLDATGVWPKLDCIDLDSPLWLDVGNDSASIDSSLLGNPQTKESKAL